MGHLPQLCPWLPIPTPYLCAGISCYVEGSEYWSNRKPVCSLHFSLKKNKKEKSLNIHHSSTRERTSGPCCIYVFIRTWKKVIYKDIHTLIWTDGTSYPTYPLCYIEKMSFPPMPQFIRQHIGVTIVTLKETSFQIALKSAIQMKSAL